ncbi:MAG: phosphocholine cytidylyltransferase family protein [Deltaproteobacteria bacterium]|nr:phosphocholine cytidylyltransferase family protein [Candidatus Zymogenaceae bacterium]
MEAVILAAGLGRRLRPILGDQPKCLLEINGQTLLERLICQLRGSGVRQIWIVVGYMADMIRERFPSGKGLSYVYNPQYATGNNVMSLYKALDHVRGEFTYIMGDCIYEDDLLSQVDERDDEVAIAVDFSDRCTGDDVMVSVSDGRVVRIGKKIDVSPTTGYFAGAVRIGREALSVLRNELGAFAIRKDNRLYTSKALDEMIRRGSIQASFVDVTGLFWDEIDTPDDFMRVKGNINQGVAQAHDETYGEL